MAAQNRVKANLLSLPDEVLLEIISWVPYDALVSNFWNAASTSTRLRRVTTDGTLPKRIIHNQHAVYILLGCAPISKNSSDWNNVKLLWSLWQSEQGFEQLFETATAKRAGMIAVALLHTVQNASFPTRYSSVVDQRHNAEERIRILYLNLFRVLQALPPNALLLLRWLFDTVSRELDIDDMVEHIPMDWGATLVPAVPWTVTYCFRCMFPMQMLTMHSGFSHLIEPFQTNIIEHITPIMKRQFVPAPAPASASTSGLAVAAKRPRLDKTRHWYHLAQHITTRPQDDEDVVYLHTRHRTQLFSLPDELLLRVVSHVPYTRSNLINIERVCKRLCNIIDDQSLPKQIALSQTPELAYLCGLGARACNFNYQHLDALFMSMRRQREFLFLLQTWIPQQPRVAMAALAINSLLAHLRRTVLRRGSRIRRSMPRLILHFTRTMRRLPREALFLIRYISIVCYKGSSLERPFRNRSFELRCSTLGLGRPRHTQAAIAASRFSLFEFCLWTSSGDEIRSDIARYCDSQEYTREITEQLAMLRFVPKGTASFWQLMFAAMDKLLHEAVCASTSFHVPSTKCKGNLSPMHVLKHKYARSESINALIMRMFDTPERAYKMIDKLDLHQIGEDIRDEFATE